MIALAGLSMTRWWMEEAGKLRWIAGTSGRGAGLELGYAGPGQRRGDLQLLSMAEGHARGLLTVTQRGVDDPDWSVFTTLQLARHLTREIVTHRWGTPRCTLHTPGSGRR